VVDLFEEVDEQLRSDQVQNALRRVAPIVTGALALVILGYLGFWGYRVWQDRNLTMASVAYQQGIDDLSKNDAAAAQASFATAVRAGPAGYKTLALMQEGGLAQTAGKTAEAVGDFDQAAKAAPNQILGDLARLRAAEALLDTAPYAELQTRLTPLADPKRPYSLYAREALAMAKLQAGKTAEAKHDFSLLSLSLGVPDDMRQRCQLAIALIDSGEGGAAAAAAKAAATMPPSPPLTLPAPPGTPPSGAAPSTAPGQGGPVSPPAGAAQ
jgi:hypothetical protein